MKTIIFFELSDFALQRFPKWICDELIDIPGDKKYVFIHLYPFSKKGIDLKNILPPNSEIINLNFRMSKVKSILSQHKDVELVTMAQRIPEYYLITMAKAMGIRTHIVQHGIFIPFMKREPELFIRSLRKSFTYVSTAFLFAKKTGGKYREFIQDLRAIYLKGSRKVRETSLPTRGINQDVFYVYGDYWKAYFIDNFGFSSGQFVKMGTPDLYDIPKNIGVAEGIGYVCQTLVEDGRLSRDAFLSFIVILNQSIPLSEPLFLKFHPRSDQTLYSKLLERDNCYIIRNEFPDCKRYIGHYSTLLVRAMFNTESVFLWEFEGHKIPEYFEELSAFKGSTLEALNDFIESERLEPNLKKLEYYFGAAEKNPFRIVAEYISA